MCVHANLMYMKALCGNETVKCFKRVEANLTGLTFNFSTDHMYKYDEISHSMHLKFT